MVRVWDIFVRVFHWSMVVAVVISFLTEDDTLLLHIVAGYYAAGLVGLRIVWGFVGPKHARFGDFLYPPATVLAYARDLVKLRSKRYLGHSPAGGAMIVALLAALVAVSWTGHVAYIGEETPAIASIAKELHEALSDILLLLVALHVGGVLWASYAHRENLAWSMITGEKRNSG